MSMQINKSAYEKLIKEDIEWLLSNTKDSLERRHIVEVLNYSPERLYASGSSEIPNDLEEAAENYEKKHTYQRYDGGGLTPEYDATLAEAFIAGAKWQAEQDLAEMAQSKSPLSVAYANRCFENGKQAMKEQMMKDALHGWLDEDNEPPYDLNVLCEEKIPFGKFKHRDKVKIIIVKED